jgi:hypothetical protein
LLRTLVSFFASTSPRAQAATQHAKLSVKGHGRLEVYQLRSTTALNEYLAREYQWSDLGQVACIEHTRIVLATGEVSQTTHYLITTLSPSAAPAAVLLRDWHSHWQIENRSHWVRDVVFAEDASRTRTGLLPEVLALLRAAVITRCRLASLDSITAARSQASADFTRAAFLIGIPLE